MESVIICPGVTLFFDGGSVGFCFFDDRVVGPLFFWSPFAQGDLDGGGVVELSKDLNQRIKGAQGGRLSSSFNVSLYHGSQDGCNAAQADGLPGPVGVSEDPLDVLVDGGFLADAEGGEILGGPKSARNDHSLVGGGIKVL